MSVLRRTLASAHAFSAREVVRDARLEVVFGLEAELVARPRHVVHAMRRIRHAEEVQPGADLDVGVRDVLAEDALEVPSVEPTPEPML